MVVLWGSRIRRPLRLYYNVKIEKSGVRTLDIRLSKDTRYTVF